MFSQHYRRCPEKGILFSMLKGKLLSIVQGFQLTISRFSAALLSQPFQTILLIGFLMS
jgi:hypothetical protein